MNAVLREALKQTNQEAQSHSIDRWAGIYEEWMQGGTYREIGHKFQVSQTCARQHVLRIQRKLRVLLSNLKANYRNMSLESDYLVGEMDLKFIKAVEDLAWFKPQKALRKRSDLP